MSLEDWTGKRGNDYTDKWWLGPTGLDDLWKKMAGITRTEIYEQVLCIGSGCYPKVLELGCNCGNQLRLLNHIGFDSKNLWGVDVNRYAVEIAVRRGYNVVEAAADDTPFKPNFAELVMCCGVLSHIEPNLVSCVFKEIERLDPVWILITEYCDGQEWNGFRHGEVDDCVGDWGHRKWRLCDDPMIHKGEGSEMFTIVLEKCP